MAASGQHLGWIKKGDTLLEWKQYKQAVDAYDKAIKLKSNCIEAWLGKGKALLESRDYDRAIAAFEKVIKLKPQDFEGYYYKAAALAEAQRFEETTAFYQEVTVLLPQESGAWFFQGMFLSHRAQYPEALAALDRAIQLSATPMYLMTRSITLEKMGRNQEALDDLDRMLLTGEAASVWVDRAKLLEKLGDYEEAIDSYGQASRCEPRLMEPWENRVALLLQLNRFDEAHKIALTLVEVFVDFEPVCTLMGQVMRCQGNYAEAIAYYSQALALDPETPAAFYGLAICYALQDQRALAQDNLERAIALAESYRETAQTEAAFSSLLAVPALNPAELPTDNPESSTELPPKLPINATD
jgi:tetratricopeptide (TPR) repeat protein